MKLKNFFWVDMPCIVGIAKRKVFKQLTTTYKYAEVTTREIITNMSGEFVVVSKEFGFDKKLFMLILRLIKYLDQDFKIYLPKVRKIIFYDCTN